MSPQRRPGKKLVKALLPIVLIPVVVLAGVTGYIVYRVAHPPQQDYLVTPENFKSLPSERGLRATEETWNNQDGTQARGWLLRGAEGAPAVVLLHRYGTDRSWLLNLGVKLNETTNFTVLWPDLRAHGLNPKVGSTSFGSLEGEDAAAALAYLRSLKTQQGRPLVGERFGLYGVELGAYAALQAAAQEQKVQALALDSAPASPGELLRATVRSRMGINNGLLHTLARYGASIYSLGGLKNPSACQLASSVNNRRVLLLTGEDAPEYLRTSTTALALCFPAQTTIEIKSDLPLTGFNLPSATGIQGEAYDRRVIDFFDKALRPTP
jgi:pimeloyl-ACP methyl ester carboxylesterase